MPSYCGGWVDGHQKGPSIFFLFQYVLRRVLPRCPGKVFVPKVCNSCENCTKPNLFRHPGHRTLQEKAGYFLPHIFKATGKQLIKKSKYTHIDSYNPIFFSSFSICLCMPLESGPVLGRGSATWWVMDASAW